LKLLFFGVFSKWIVDNNPKKIFGVELSDLAKRDSPVKGLPAIVVHTAQWLTEFGIVEGIFRKSGASKEMDLFKNKYDEGQIESTSSLDPKTDPNTIAGLMKLFFRQLPTPITPPSHYQKFLEINIDDDDCITQVKNILNTLPKVNFMCLHYLCKFLEDHAKHSSITKMDVSNLSIVFATNIIRPKKETKENSLKFSRVTNLFTKMIINVHQLFMEDSDPMHEDSDWFSEIKFC